MLHEQRRMTERGFSGYIIGAVALLTLSSRLGTELDTL